MAKKQLEMAPSRARQRAEEETRQEAPSSADVTYKKTLVSMTTADLAWLDQQVKQYRRDTGNPITKSQLIRVALELLRQHGVREAIKKTS